MSGLGDGELNFCISNNIPTDARYGHTTYHALNARLTVASMFSGVIPIGSSSHDLNILMVVCGLTVGNSSHTFNKAT